MADARQFPPARRAAPRERETRSILGRVTDVMAVNRSAYDRSLASLPIRALQQVQDSQWTASAAQQAVVTDARSAAAHVAVRPQLRDVRRGQRLRSRRYDPSIPDRWVAPRRAGSKP